MLHQWEAQTIMTLGLDCTTEVHVGLATDLAELGKVPNHQK